MDSVKDLPVIVAGHSHVAALGVPTGRQAAVLPPGEVPLVTGDPRFTAFNGPWPRDEAYWDALVTCASNRKIAIAWEGNQHQAVFLFQSQPVFDFVLTSDPNIHVDVNAVIVPESSVRAKLAAAFAGLDSLLKRLVSIKGCRPIVLGTVAPRSSEEDIRRILLADVYFNNLAQKQGLDLSRVELTPPWMMLKLWSLVQDMLRETAKNNDVQFVSVPANSRSAAGFTHENLMDDLTHGNLDYGRMMLDHLMRVANW